MYTTYIRIITCNIYNSLAIQLKTNDIIYRDIYTLLLVDILQRSMSHSINVLYLTNILIPHCVAQCVFHIVIYFIILFVLVIEFLSFTKLTCVITIPCYLKLLSDLDELWRLCRLLPGDWDIGLGDIELLCSEKCECCFTVPDSNITFFFVGDKESFRWELNLLFFSTDVLHFFISTSIILFITISFKVLSYLILY